MGLPEYQSETKINQQQSHYDNDNGDNSLFYKDL